MKVNIIRGKNQSGGNIIEITTEKTKILLDAGLELDGGNTLPDIRGLFDFAGYDAIFVSHYHSDHLGLVYRAHKDIPVYMGEGCYKIVSASDRYKKQETVPDGMRENGAAYRNPAHKRSRRRGHDKNADSKSKPHGDYPCSY